MIMTLLCACGGKQEISSAAAKTAAVNAAGAAETEAEEKIAGEYPLYAVESEGLIIGAADMEMNASLILNEDGTGGMTMDDDYNAFESWSAADGIVSILADGETATGTIENGVIKLELETDFYGYFCKEGADTSGIAVMSMDDLLKLYSSEETTAANDDTAEESGHHSEHEESEHHSDHVDDHHSDLADKVGIWSDDTHFVIEMAGVLLVYEHDGTNVTKCTGYYDMVSEAVAQKAVESMESSDPDIESVTVEGSVMVIHYHENKVKDQTVQGLELAFGDSKILKG